MGFYLIIVCAILIKYFNFQLTNIYYHHKEIDINQVTEIKNFDYLNKLNNYFINYDINSIVIQCSNLFDFPSNFE
jgi:hypothetical protein